MSENSENSLLDKSPIKRKDKRPIYSLYQTWYIIVNKTKGVIEMRTVDVKVYTIDELEGASKKEAIENVREQLDFSTDIFLHLKDVLKNETHLTESDLDIYFSLAYVQGDGVSLDGTLSNEDIIAIGKEYVPRFYKLLQSGITDDIYIRVESGRGQRTRFLDMTDMYTGYDLTEYPRLEKVYDELIEAVESVVIETIKVLEHVGYSEIDYLESSQHIESIIELNEYEFTADGELFQEHLS